MVFLRSAATLKGSLATVLVGAAPTRLVADARDKAVEFPDRVVVEAVELEGPLTKVAETVRMVVEL